MSAFDHGMLNLPLGHRGRGKSIERTIDDAVKEIAAEKRAENERIKLARREALRAEKLRKKFTAEDLATARIVSDGFGWHRVVRVNAKSVTITGMHSPTERIPISQITKWR
ncbi:hypothetical protein [Aeromicrobium sp. UC242_57]|uniref:hypothetical protein n=1 Tax=Aeromicrobium sp. UC242_57 TaxID=3374624 RepID=UPI0037A28EBC